MFWLTMAFIAGWYARGKREGLSRLFGKVSAKASKTFDELLK